MRRLAFALVAAMLATPALACGPDTDCVIGDRTYRIDPLPDASGKNAGKSGALIFAHGYKGTAEGTMKNMGLRQVAHDMGYALVAADAGKDDDWQIPNVPRNRDNDGSREFAYFSALVDDLVANHGIDRANIIVSGFSAGGMMTWELACHMGNRFRAFIAISGTFWAPEPKSCPNPAGDLVHIHGTDDKIVPLDGRPIADTRQGRVATALDLLRRIGRYGADRRFTAGDLSCDEEDNAARRILVFCTHPGGHSIKPDWVRTALHLIRREPVGG